MWDISLCYQEGSQSLEKNKWSNGEKTQVQYGLLLHVADNLPLPILKMLLLSLARNSPVAVCLVTFDCQPGDVVRKMSGMRFQ